MRARPPLKSRGARRFFTALFCLALVGGCRAQPPAPADLLSSTDFASEPKVEKTAKSCAASDPDLDVERDEITKSLAKDPDDPEKLAAAAEFYLSRLPASTSHSEIGLLYARRGTEKLLQRTTFRPAGKKNKAALVEAKLATKKLFGRLALLEGQALVDLGKSREGLPRIDAALRFFTPHLDDKLEADARYERAVALFEVCELALARRAFEDWLVRYPKDELESAAWTHHHLGLTLEFLGETEAAERELGVARKLKPEQFLEPLPISAEEFRRIVDEQAKGLPEDKQRDLSLVQFATADLPDLLDLTLEEPPLSPTILGLYRGLPLGEEPSEPRAILLYRKNLLRMVRSREELYSEVRTTLLHELGHLHGQDEDDLRAQGLE